MVIISLSNIFKIYNVGGEEVRALDGVDLEIKENEYLAIMGPSGSGKSTMMNMIGWLDTPSSGSYEFEGEMVNEMKPGTVMVDISIDQGGCFETSKTTTHDDPTYLVNGVVHYCVANMPGSVPLTATEALNSATLPYVLDIANKGLEDSLKEDDNLYNGLNLKNNEIVHKSVKEAFNL